MTRLANGGTENVRIVKENDVIDVKNVSYVFGFMCFFQEEFRIFV